MDTNMKHWVEGKSNNGYGEKGILIKSGNERILSVVKNGNGFEFTEECNGVFSHTYTKQETLELIQELKYWISKH